MNNHELLYSFLAQKEIDPDALLLEDSNDEDSYNNKVILLIDFVTYCLQKGTTNDELSEEEIENINFLKKEILKINKIDVPRFYQAIKVIVEEELIMMANNVALDLNEIKIKLCLKDIFNLSDTEYQEMGDAHIKYLLHRFKAENQYEEVRKLIDNGFISMIQWEEINNPSLVSYELQRNERYISKKVQAEVWERDHGRCVECGSEQFLEFDHIVPFSKGGSNTARNIQLLCKECNRKKYNNF